MNEFIDFAFSLIVIAFIIQIGWWMITAWQNLNKKIQLAMLKQVSLKIHSVRIEEHSNQTYWYDNETSLFLAQGNVMNEIVESLKSNFPDHIFFINDFGISKHTDWKLISKEEFEKIKVEMYIDV
jgi:uncharacterized protein YacL (UPF0231 family)